MHKVLEYVSSERQRVPVCVWIGGENTDGSIEVLHAGGDDVVEGGASARGSRHSILEAVKHLGEF